MSAGRERGQRAAAAAERQRTAEAREARRQEREERQVDVKNQITAREALLANLEAELELSRDIKLINEAIAETDAEREETAEERKRRMAAERAAERERQELARLTASIQKELRETELNEIAEGRERDLQELQDWYDERVTQAANNADLLAMIEEVRGLREAQINEKYRAEAEQKEREFQQKLRELRAQYDIASGASEQVVLQAQIDRINRTLEAEQDGTEEYRRLVLEREKLAVRLANVQAREAERAAKAVEQAEQRAAREAERALQQRIRSAEGYTRARVDALDAAIRFDSRYTEASIALSEKRFEEERQALLERQRLGEDVNAELRVLAEERAAFEKQVAEEGQRRHPLHPLRPLRGEGGGRRVHQGTVAEVAAAQLVKLRQEPHPVPHQHRPRGRRHRGRVRAGECDPQRGGVRLRRVRGRAPACRHGLRRAQGGGRAGPRAHRGRPRGGRPQPAPTEVR